jgi:hypothetical protein
VTVRPAEFPAAEINLADWLIRGYLLDDHLHFYRKSELANPAFTMLIPMCGQDPMYPQRHDRLEVPRDFMAGHGICPNCAVLYVDAEDARGTIPRGRHARGPESEHCP